MSTPPPRRPSNRDAWSVLDGVTATPGDDLEVPAIVVEIASGRPVRPIWVNELGGLTCEIGDHTSRWFVKWTPPGTGASASEETARMAWLAPFSRVPQVLDVVDDPHSEATVLVTTALPGETAVADKWKADPATAVAVIGRGLRYLHEHAPADRCPFAWSAVDRVAHARQLVAAGRTQPSDRHPVHQALTLKEAMRILESPPPVDTAVVVPRRRLRPEHDHR